MTGRFRTVTLIAWMFLLAVAACDPSMLPGRTRPAPAPVAEAPPPAPPAAATPGEEARPPDLAEQVKALEARIQNLEMQLKGLRESRYPAATAAGPRPGPQAVPSAATPPSPPSPGAAKPGLEDKTFGEGMRLYQAKKYASARDKFHAYLRSQPQGPRAAEARFYLADSFYQEKKYREAGVEFNKVLTQHPRSPLAPAAMLRQALCYHHLNQKANYQTTLKKLVQKYPQSPEAKEAQKWLKDSR